MPKRETYMKREKRIQREIHELHERFDAELDLSLKYIPLTRVVRRIHALFQDILPNIKRVHDLGPLRAAGVRSALLSMARDFLEASEGFAGMLGDEPDADHAKWQERYGVPVAAIATKLGVSRPTAYKILGKDQ